MLYLAFVLVLSQPPEDPSAAAASVAELNAQAARLSETDPEQSLEVARTALAAARARQDAAGESDALNNVAVACRALGAPELAAETSRALPRARRSQGQPLQPAEL